MHGTPAGLKPIPGIELILGAMQHAPQPARQAITVSSVTGLFQLQVYARTFGRLGHQ